MIPPSGLVTADKQATLADSAAATATDGVAKKAATEDNKNLKFFLGDDDLSSDSSNEADTDSVGKAKSPKQQPPPQPPSATSAAAAAVKTAANPLSKAQQNQLGGSWHTFKQSQQEANSAASASNHAGKTTDSFQKYKQQLLEKEKREKEK